jgi:alpha-glucosidase
LQTGRGAIYPPTRANKLCLYIEKEEHPVDRVLPDTLDARSETIVPPGYEALGSGQVVEKETARVRVSAGEATVEVTVLAPDLFRVGFFPSGHAMEYDSVAVCPRAAYAGSVTLAEDDGCISLATPSFNVHIALDPVRVHFSDQEGRVFAADEQTLGMGSFTLAEQAPRLDVPNAVGTVGMPVRLYKQHLEHEYYFGCGERTSTLNKTDSHQLFWNVDPLPGHTALQNNLYVSIPFVLTLNEGQAWGLFFDSMAETQFDLAKESVERSWFGSSCGDLVYYVCCGPTPRDVLAQYTELTGHTPMPPRWSLGNGQSRYSYETADEVLRIAHSFREKDIPCDTLYLDIDYMDGYRDFSWDRTRFPDPEGLLTELQGLGFHVVPLVDAGVKVDVNDHVYQQGHEQELFCKTIDGYEYQNTVWPGVCAFPDFFNQAVREWWGDTHRGLVDAGVAGIWCDMNEPAMFIPHHSTMPDDVVHMWQGKTKVHKQVHNGYGALMVQAVREGLQRLRADRRPFVISRSGYAGVQRNALIWTGDNSSTWDHLSMSVPQLLNLSLSGVAWCGVDIGGFYGDADGELLSRWIELGIFQAFCRNHAEKMSRPQEPWVFGEPYTAICRSLLQLRQRLLPYLYTLFEECHRTGAPLLRPLFWAYPEDSATYAIEDELLCGDSVLVAPITRPGTQYRHVYLPEGDWVHFWSGEVISGPAHVLAYAPLGQPAFYIRANQALPLGPVTNYSGESAEALPRPSDINDAIASSYRSDVCNDSLTLLLYVNEGKGATTLYEDEGEGYGYEQGLYAQRTVACEVAGEGIQVRLSEREGNFVPRRQQVLVELRGIQSAPVAVSLNDQAVDWRYVQEGRSITIEVPETGAASVLLVRFAA